MAGTERIAEWPLCRSKGWKSDIADAVMGLQGDDDVRGSVVAESVIRTVAAYAIYIGKCGPSYTRPLLSSKAADLPSSISLQPLRTSTPV